MSKRKIHPPDESKEDTKRIEFKAPKDVWEDFHAFKNKYNHANQAKALEHLLKVASRHPNLFLKQSL